MVGQLAVGKAGDCDDGLVTTATVRCGTSATGRRGVREPELYRRSGTAVAPAPAVAEATAAFSIHESDVLGFTPCRQRIPLIGRKCKSGCRALGAAKES